MIEIGLVQYMVIHTGGHFQLVNILISYAVSESRAYIETNQLAANKKKLKQKMAKKEAFFKNPV